MFAHIFLIYVNFLIAFSKGCFLCSVFHCQYFHVPTNSCCVVP